MQPFDLDNLKLNKSNMPDKQAAWWNAKREVRRLNDKLGMPVDKNIVETVAILRMLGFNTTASCGGHIRRSTSGPYVIFQASKARHYAALARETTDVKDAAYAKLRKKANYYRAIDLKRMSGYLEDFYQRHFFDYHSHIIVQSMPMALNILKCHGAEIVLAVDQKTKKSIVERDQAEMNEFTEFLKAKFFTE